MVGTLIKTNFITNKVKITFLNLDMIYNPTKYHNSSVWK